MENASKALIIAGAILLSILIIALGMSVYNNASSTVGKSDMSSQEISSHNATFEAYGGRIKGSQLKALNNAIRKNNSEYADRVITCQGTPETEAGGSGNSGDTVFKTAKINNSTTYHVYFQYEGNDGLINGCAAYVYGAADDENPFDK